MRVLRFALATAILAVLILVPSVHAWTAVDHEIFRLNDEIQRAEGGNITFYSFLKVSPTASHAEIVKAHRRRAAQLHPDKAVPAMLTRQTMPKKDKNTGKKYTVKKSATPGERKRITREATERYQRLGVIAEVLKGPGRERYDHFLANGFPRWRGSGYYYARFRPGLGGVLLGLALVFGGGLHYGALYLGWKRHRDFVERYMRHARKMAWGNETGIPGLPGSLGVDAPLMNGPAEVTAGEDDSEPQMPRNRREKRQQDKEAKKKEKLQKSGAVRTSGVSRPIEAGPVASEAVPTGAKKRVVAENGKVLIVDSEGNVFLEETTEDGETRELLLDPDEIPRPSIFDTALIRVPLWLYSKSVGRIFGGKAGGLDPDDPLLQNQDVIVQSPEAHSEKVVDEAAAMNQNADTRRRKAKQQQRQ